MSRSVRRPPDPHINPDPVSSGRLTHAAVRALDWLAERILVKKTPYFYLRRRGEVKVARNFRSPHHRGEIDLIAWDQDVLCFIEAKARTRRDVKPVEAAVDRAKQHALKAVARHYLRHLAPSCQWRFDGLSVYHETRFSQPLFELFPNAFPVS